MFVEAPLDVKLKHTVFMLTYLSFSNKRISGWLPATFHLKSCRKAFYQKASNRRLNHFRNSCNLHLAITIILTITFFKIPVLTTFPQKRADLFSYTTLILYYLQRTDRSLSEEIISTFIANICMPFAFAWLSRQLTSLQQFFRINHHLQFKSFKLQRCLYFTFFSIASNLDSSPDVSVMWFKVLGCCLWYCSPLAAVPFVFIQYNNQYSVFVIYLHSA